MLAACDIFRADYAYFSSHSSSWLKHAKTYVEDMAMRFGLTAGSRHVEIASNDGYLLQYSKAKGINAWASSRAKASRWPAERKASTHALNSLCGLCAVNWLRKAGPPI